MSLILKQAIPLLDDNLCMEDFLEDNGFVNAYTYDKNRPYLNNHVFLMFDPAIPNFERDVRFRSLNNMYDKKVEYIKGKPYIIYSFTLVNSELKPLIHKGIKPYSVKNLTKINAFWRGWDKELNEYMFHKSKKLCNNWESVPEYDYRPPMNVTVQIRKSESVDKTTPSLYFLYINLRLNKYISRVNTRIFKSLQLQVL